MTAENGPHLLVVDDEAGIREMLTIVFQKDGYRVSAARGCVEGLALLDGEVARPRPHGPQDAGRHGLRHPEEGARTRTATRPSS